MEITAEFAQSIVEEIEKIIHKNINFMNREGQIIASTDKKRIGDFHEGALEVLRTKKKVVVKNDEQLKGAKPGINLPVYFNDQIIGVIGITGDEKEVGHFGEIIKKMTEILVKEAYLEQQMELERRARETFINEWLEENIDNEKLFASRGWMLGINVHLPRIAIILDLIDFNDLIYDKLKTHQIDVKGELKVQSTRSNILKMIEDYFKYEHENIVFMSGISKYVILMTVNTNKSIERQKEVIQSRIEQIIEMITKKYSTDVAAGVGRFHPDMRGTSKSYKEAKRTVEIARKHKKILFYDQLGIESFIDEISLETKLDFIERILPVKKHEEIKQLIETLQTFFECNQSLNEAANKLFIHKNTLQYRLKRIKDLTGYDPRKFTDALMLYVALSFYLDDVARQE
jgi:carbohydrate diacid regulator